MSRTHIFCLRRMRARRSFATNDRGVTLIEFALVLPVLLIVFIGLVEFGQAYMVSRKLTTAANAVSDLISQEPSVSCAYLDDVKLAANEIMKPFNAPSILVVSIVEDAVTTNKSVTWSYPAGTASYTLPQSGIIGPGSSLIVAVASYNFTPTISRFLGTFQITERAFFRPRLSKTVAKTGAC